MIRIFDAGQASDEARALIHGGLLVQADARADIDRLVTFALQLTSGEGAWGRYLVPEQGNRDPLRALYADLLAGGTRLGAVEVGRESEPRWRDAFASLLGRDPRGPWEALILALVTLYDTWDAPPKRESALQFEEPQLLLAIAEPSAAEPHPVEMTFSANAAALVLQPGSLVASFALEGGVKGYGWIVAVVARGKRLLGRTAQPAAKRLVDGAREQAEQRAVYVFPRLDQLRPAERQHLQTRPLVLVFLHGLFATDLGTFDGLISRLRAANPLVLWRTMQDLAAKPPAVLAGHRNALAELAAQLEARVAAFLKAQPKKAEKLLLARTDDPHVANAVDATIGIVGWPHNTLTSIQSNGGQLADMLARNFLPNPPRIILVCHSRGGLVARAAAVELLKNPGKEQWRTSLAGLITFGTPHDGASIAEHGLRDLATYLLLLQSTRNMASLNDVLTYLDARTAEGIEQLKRDEATTASRERSFIERLYEEERALKDTVGRRQPQVTAIGGTLSEPARNTWRKRAAASLVDRWLDTPEHDLVVELDSSLSSRVDPTITVQTTCDHFSYFDALEQRPVAADVALARIWAEIDLSAAFQAMDTAPAGYFTAPRTAKFKFPPGKLPDGG